MSTATKEQFRIEGMHCASCASTIERSLKKVSGIEEAAVNLATETASVTYDKDRVEENDIRKAVADAGYAVAQSESQVTLGIEGMVRSMICCRMWISWSTAPRKGSERRTRNGIGISV